MFLHFPNKKKKKSCAAAAVTFQLCLCMHRYIWLVRVPVFRMGSIRIKWPFKSCCSFYEGYSVLNILVCFSVDDKVPPTGDHSQQLQACSALCQCLLPGCRNQNVEQGMCSYETQSFVPQPFVPFAPLRGATFAARNSWQDKNIHVAGTVSKCASDGLRPGWGAFCISRAVLGTLELRCSFSQPRIRRVIFNFV